MTMKYYDDNWDEIRDVFTAWWQRRKPTRPAVGVVAPRAAPLPGAPAEPPEPVDLKAKWRNAPAILARFEAYAARHFHAGCHFPYLTASLGPGNLNLYLGSEAVYMPETIWYTPCFKDPAKANVLFRPESEYWQWTIETTKFYRNAARGKFLAGVPDLIEGLDILSELLGTQELLTYLIDCPQEIHRLLNQIDGIYWQAFEPLYNLVKDERGGNAFIAFQIWGPGRTLKSQCDFSAMISPDMFAEFVCPYLERQCARAAFSVFHLDGPSCIRHLEHLVKVPSLKAVQWTPGYPNPAAADHKWWDSIWRPVYTAGKAALVLGNPPELVEPFLKEFGWTGTYIGTGCKTEQEARKLLEHAQQWGG
jgi:5-methyltetrahydrofolate--homocysteine methyltransferase